ncbi:hypothetical protein QBC37DRAFT_424201 [Rhypophila decipiens]|uniref:Uncharacterized protein n=1 Tax=Rhypophila decipiens TaxID=261697 RepID=A0AAN7B9D6_9PEZI|nr:hypothetical protein QBC37DRAFT_424201 [Rhypophila decipiens]
MAVCNREFLACLFLPFRALHGLNHLPNGWGISTTLVLCFGFFYGHEHAIHNLFLRRIPFIVGFCRCLYGVYSWGLFGALLFC